MNFRIQFFTIKIFLRWQLKFLKNQGKRKKTIKKQLTEESFRIQRIWLLTLLATLDFYKTWTQLLILRFSKRWSLSMNNQNLFSLHLHRRSGVIRSKKFLTKQRRKQHENSPLLQNQNLRLQSRWKNTREKSIKCLKTFKSKRNKITYSPNKDRKTRR